ncbi:unnamed protein product, partial [Ilex paraguariensis]
LEYAALDAAVLVHIFRQVRSNSHPASDVQMKIEWKSYIVYHMDNLKKTKEETRSKKEPDAGACDT